MLQKLAQNGATIKNIGSMCDDCAFKKGSDANNDKDAVAAAANCLWDDGPPHFNCHTADFTDAGKPCVGYQYAMQYLKNM